MVTTPLPCEPRVTAVTTALGVWRVETQRTALAGLSGDMSIVMVDAGLLGDEAVGVETAVVEERTPDSHKK